MPIYLSDRSAAISGKVQPTMGAFTSSMTGASGTLPDVTGFISRTMGNFRARFIEPTTSSGDFPRFAGPRVGTRDWGDDPTVNGRTDGNGDVNTDSRQAMGYCDFVVIGSQTISASSAGSLAGKIAAVEDWLDWRDANAPWCATYDYVGLQESGGSDSENVAKLESESGPNGLLDWWVYDDYTAGASANKVSSFGGAFHGNITRYVTPDSNGEIYPEWYANHTKERMLTLNTPTNQRLGLFNDVTDHRHRAPSSTSPGSQFDYNGDGLADNGRSGWQDGGLGQETAEAYREGHRIYFDRLRADNPGIGIIANNTTWGMELADEDFVSTWRENPHTFYGDMADGGWVEFLTHGSTAANPFSGVVSSDAGITIKAFGSWRLAMNMYLGPLMWLRGPKHQLAEWRAWIGSSSISLTLGGELNPLVGSNMDSSAMRVARWGLCSTLMDDGYMGFGNGRRVHNSAPQMDEFGTVNTSTTGLSRKWLGGAVDASMIEKEFVSGASSRWIGASDSKAIFKREFDNGLALVNTSKSLSSSFNITIPVVVGADESNGELESGKWKLISGAQDPNVNTGAEITSDLTIGGIDGRLLQRV